MRPRIALRQHSQEGILESYRRALLTFGREDFRSLIWSGKESACLRYNVMRRHCAFDDARVLDLGCGFGSFVRCGFRAREYFGVDIVPEFIAIAKDGAPNWADYELSSIESFLTDAKRQQLEFDVALVSGVTGNRGGPADNPAKLEDFLASLCSIACTVLVNFPSSHATCRTEGIEYFEPTQALSVALRITPRVVLDHSYLQSDFLLVLRAFEKP